MTTFTHSNHIKPMGFIISVGMMVIIGLLSTFCALPSRGFWQSTISNRSKNYVIRFISFWISLFISSSGLTIRHFISLCSMIFTKKAFVIYLTFLARSIFQTSKTRCRLAAVSFSISSLHVGPARLTSCLQAIFTIPCIAFRKRGCRLNLLAHETPLCYSLISHDFSCLEVLVRAARPIQAACFNNNPSPAIYQGDF